MPVHVNDLVTEVITEPDQDTNGAEDEAARPSERDERGDLKYAHERLLREQLRTRAEDFSD